MSNKLTFKYKTDHDLEERKSESSRILKEYPNRVPIICEVASNSVLPPLRKTKYLVPYDMCINQFEFLIRRNIDLNQDSALFLFTPTGKTFSGNKTMMEVYNNHKDKQDNFFYIYCDCEVTMG